MNFIFRYLVIVLVVLSAGCAGEFEMSKHSKSNLSNRRAPVNNALSDNERISDNRSVPRVEQDGYYAFNSYNEEVNYYKPPKEVFVNHKHKKKSKSNGKKVKIYKKVHKKETAINKGSIKQPQKVDSAKPISGIIKVVPKKDGGNKGGVRKLDPIEFTKGGMDIVKFQNQQELPSNLDIERDVAAFDQDPISFDKSSTEVRQGSKSNDAPKLLPKKSEDDGHITQRNEGADNKAHDLESRPIPLPFD